MTNQSQSPVKNAVIEKIVQLPDDSVWEILSLVDSLIEQQKHKQFESLEALGADDITNPKDIKTWEQWFDEVDQLPADPEASKFTGLTKQERRKVIADDLEEKYQRHLSTFPFKKGQ